MEENNLINVKSRKNEIIGGILYLIFLTITGINLYTKLINESTCGLKSKILFCVLFFGTAIVTGIIIVLINKKKKIKPENVFLVTATIFGIIYMFATPLFKGHDEQYHWYKSYAVSMGEFRASTNEEGTVRRLST